MEALKLLYTVIRSNIGKVIIIFLLSGIAGVLGIVPGTENVSNVVGAQITSVKATLGTTASPTVVQ